MARDTVKILDVKFDKVNAAEAFNKFTSFLNAGKFSMIFTPNPEIVMMAQSDPEYMNVLNDGDLVIPDGIGIIYASRIKSLGLSERVPGIELMEKILNHCNNARKSIYLLGGKEGISTKAALHITEKYPNIKIAGFSHGYFTDEEELSIVDDINELKPDVLFVALSAPRQEKWIYTHRKILNCKVAMGVGGSLDVWAGIVKRAPSILRKIHLEWLYRYLVNPSRLVRITALPKFIVKVLMS